MVSRVGIEPTTYGLKGRCSTTELPARILRHVLPHFKEFLIKTTQKKYMNPNVLIKNSSKRL